MTKINISELVGKNAISMQSGEKLFSRIHPILIEDNKLELDFTGVSLYASPFFNASIGLLLKDLSIEKIQSLLIFTGLSEVGRDLLNHVIRNAIVFYKDGNKVSKAIDQSTFGNDSNA